MNGYRRPDCRRQSKAASVGGHLFGNPSFIAALAFEHVKGPPPLRIRHAGTVLGLLTAF
jgi:hypothetical protein